MAAEGLKLVWAAAAINPAPPELHFVEGLCLAAVGRHNEALEAFRRELARNPNHTAARAHYDDLERALSRPMIQQIPTHQRSWHTSVPRQTLLGIQHALHNYHYRGVPLLKNPFDFAIYPLLLWQLKPRTIIEIGSKSGGSAIWLADVLNNFGIDGHVYSVDIVRVTKVTHPRVIFLEGSGRSLGESFTVEFLQRLPRPLLVIEDADHAYETSIATLQFFHPLLRNGEYMVVEDGIISDLSEVPDCNSGPHRALKEFLRQYPDDYEIDGNYCDFFGYNVTWCTNGFLKKVTGGSVRNVSISAGSSDLEFDASSGTTTQNARGKKLLNVGCGERIHEDWVNLDLVPRRPGVIAHDIRSGLPFADNSFSAVYHSHVLEHMRRSAAPALLRECYRVLEPGGILRVVVPDLETIAALYLKNLEGAVAGDTESARRHEWMLLELLDQMVRDESGGEMLKYWKQNPMPAESFVIERMGSEVRQCLEVLRKNPTSVPEPPTREPTNEEQVDFRASGEVHRWMYDRWSLRRLLEECGFSDVRVCAASESRIPGFGTYLLDCEEDGSTRKPDSLFVEAQKPHT